MPTLNFPDDTPGTGISIGVWRDPGLNSPLPGSVYYYNLDLRRVPTIARLDYARLFKSSNTSRNSIVGHVARALRVKAVEQTDDGFTLYVNAEDMNDLMTMQARTNRTSTRKIHYWWAVNNLPNFKELNGQVFACEVPWRFAAFRADADVPVKLIHTAPLANVENKRYEVPEEAGATLGPPFLRVEAWDANGTYRLVWDPPMEFTNGSWRSQRVDGYRIYIRKSRAWQLAHVTQGTSAVIKNVEPSADKGITVHENFFIRPLVTDGHTNGRMEDPCPEWTDKDARVFVPPADLSTWETKKYNPATSANWAQRQVYAGSEANPLEVYWSEAGHFDRFGKSEPHSPSDAFSRIVGTSRSERIRHLAVSGDLLAFSDQKEYRIIAAESGVERDGVQAKAQSNYGSSWIPPIEAQNYWIMFERTGTSMRTLRYSFETDALNSEDLSILSKDLLRGRKITSRVYAEGETPQLFVGLEDGTVACLSLFLEANVYGWWEMRTKGSIRSLSVIRDSTGLPFLHITCERRREIRGVEGKGDSAPVIYTHEIIDVRGDTWELSDSCVSIEGKNTDAICVLTGSGAASGLDIWVERGKTDDIGGVGDVVFVEGVTQSFVVSGQEDAVAEQEHVWIKERAFKITAVFDNINPTEEAIRAGVSLGREWSVLRTEPDSPIPPLNENPAPILKATCRVYEGVTQIAGLGHMEGSRVDVRTGDKIWEEDIPVEGGHVTLDSPAPRAAAGIGYGVLVETLDLLPGGELGELMASQPRDVTEVVIGSATPSQLAVTRKGLPSEVETRDGTVDEDAGEARVNLAPASTNRIDSSVIISQKACLPLGLRRISAKIISTDLPQEQPIKRSASR